MNEGAKIQYDKLLEIYKDDNQNNYVTSKMVKDDIKWIEQDSYSIDKILLKKEKNINIFEQ